MNRSSHLFLFSLLAGLLVTFSLPNHCRADLPKDQDIRKFIQDVAAQDKDGACKDLGITTDNTEGVSQVSKGIKTLGGKNVDDITRTSFQYEWKNSTETLTASYHIRTGKEGFYFFLGIVSIDKKPPSIDLDFQKAKPDPWEVQVINFTYRYGVLILLGVLVAVVLVILLLIWIIPLKQKNQS